jgi:hypothetical protein
MAQRIATESNVKLVVIELPTNPEYPASMWFPSMANQYAVAGVSAICKDAAEPG